VAGPDWIVYEEKEIAACRIMVGRDVKSLHRTIHVKASSPRQQHNKQVDQQWKSSRHLCGGFVGVLQKYPGLAGESGFVWDDNHTKINFKRLLRSPYDDDAASWMPPATTWGWFKKLVTKSALLGGCESILHNATCQSSRQLMLRLVISPNRCTRVHPRRWFALQMQSALWSVYQYTSRSMKISHCTKNQYRA
jgi:hypothetical protein